MPSITAAALKNKKQSKESIRMSSTYGSIPPASAPEQDYHWDNYHFGQVKVATNEHAKSAPATHNPTEESSGIFSEQSFLVDVDTEKQPLRQRKISSMEKYFLGRYRYVMAFYILVGLTLSHYSRSALHLAVIDMVAGSVKSRELSRFAINTDNPSGLIGNSCPVKNGLNQTEIENLDKSGSLPISVGALIKISQAKVEYDIDRAVKAGQLVDWNPTQQGLIFASAHVGSMVLGTPMSRLGEMYGTKWIIMGSCFASALHGLLLPMAATYSFWVMMVFEMVLCGLGHSVELLVYTLFSNWLSPIELTFSIGALLFTAHLAGILCSFANGQILAIGIGWQWCFYVPGILCIAWCFLWLLVGSSRLQSSRFVSDQELLYVITKNKALPESHRRHHQRQSSSKKAPWARLFKDTTVWALIINNFVLKWTNSVIGGLYPTYLNNILHVPVAVTGFVCGSTSFVGLISCFLISYIYKTILVKNPLSWSITTMRKIFQSITNFSIAGFMLLLALYDCNFYVALAVIILVSTFYSFAIGGFYQVPLDMTKEYCALIFSLSNTLAIGQAIGTPISGAIINTAPKDRYTWRMIWYIVAGQNLISGIIFILFVDCSPRDYDNDPSSNDETVKR